MALKSLVKVSHLSNLSDARFCSGMGVELLGFGAIPETGHYIPADLFQEIRGWLAGPRIIAELYGISSSGQIKEVLQMYAPDYLELSWDEYQAFGKDVTVPCIVHADNLALARAAAKDERIAYISTDESASCEDIRLLPYPVLTKIKSLEQLNTQMNAGCFDGYVLEAPQQVKAGLTSYDELGDILEALEEE